MADRPFADLKEALLQGGIAPGHVRRAVTELEDHWNALVADELRRGSNEEHARAEARRILGSDALLIDRYLARTELRAWAYRRPALWFTLMPLVSYVAVSLATMTSMILAVQLMLGYLKKMLIPDGISHLISGSVHLIFLWVYPSLIAAGFAVLGNRRRIARPWPIIGIVVLSVIASLINVDFVLTGGPKPGSAGAGIGFSTRNLLQPMTRTVTIALVAFALTRLRTRRFTASSIFD